MPKPKLVQVVDCGTDSNTIVALDSDGHLWAATWIAGELAGWRRLSLPASLSGVGGER